jgi:hypothetical protein
MAYEVVTGDTIPFVVNVYPPGSIATAKIQVFPFHGREPLAELTEADCVVTDSTISGKFFAGVIPGLYWLEVEITSGDGQVRTTTALVEALEGRIQ